MTDLNLDAIEEMCKAATEEPWDLDEYMVIHWCHGKHEHVADVFMPNDARLITESRTLIPALLAALRAERARVGKLEEENKRLLSLVEKLTIDDRELTQEEYDFAAQIPDELIKEALK